MSERAEEDAGDRAGSPARFFCECGDASCVGRVELTLAEYERLRSEPGRFVVAPGHERTPLSWIVEAGKRFSIVQADGGALWAL